MDYTLCLFKPDLVGRSLLDDALLFMSNRGFELRESRRRKLTAAEVAVLYEESANQPYYPAIEDYLLSGEVVFGIVAGPGVLSRFNEFVGATDPSVAPPGTMRHRFGQNVLINSIHSSNANRINDEISCLYKIPVIGLQSFLSRICQR